VVHHNIHGSANKEDAGKFKVSSGNEPYVKVLNMPKTSKDSAFARTREALVAKSTFN
jgi:hypothetical protein